jgi:hypothetical protein
VAHAAELLATTILAVAPGAMVDMEKNNGKNELDRLGPMEKIGD